VIKPTRLCWRSCSPLQLLPTGHLATILQAPSIHLHHHHVLFSLHASASLDPTYHVCQCRWVCSVCRLRLFRGRFRQAEVECSCNCAATAESEAPAEQAASNGGSNGGSNEARQVTIGIAQALISNSARKSVLAISSTFSPSPPLKRLSFATDANIRPSPTLSCIRSSTRRAKLSARASRQP
jgi:hypothetical protein